MKRRRVFLHTGDLIVGNERLEIKTLLGSCVSVCMWDFKEAIGGMNHFIMPEWKGRGPATPGYGNIAMELLYEKMIIMGAMNENIIAKIFGGARILGENSSITNPGTKNIKGAREFLNNINIPVVAEDTGGKNGRTIIFHTDTGEVWVKKN